MRQLPLLILIPVLLAMAAACSHGENPRLARLEKMADRDPDSAEIALDSLKTIDASSLSGNDRRYYDFLTVKISDKAYVDHKSDSLILKVIDDSKASASKSRYAEALYYGGRVYSDLGDKPQALQYFQQALDEIPDSPDNLDLRCRILSQTGRLLNKLRLYKEAAPYVEKTIEYSRQTNDTLNEVYDLQLLGEIYLHAEDYIKSDSCFLLAINKSKHLPYSFTAKSNMYRAAIKYFTEQLDSALILIRDTPNTVRPVSRTLALNYAGLIYRDAGITDSALHFIKEMHESKDPRNPRFAYQTMLSSYLIKYIPSDSLANYVLRYKQILEDDFDESEKQLALDQRAFYNYDIQVRNRKKAENKLTKFYRLIPIPIFIILLLIIGILIQKNKNKDILLKLHEALENLEDSKQAQINGTVAVLTSTQDAVRLRETLRTKIIEKYNVSTKDSMNVSPEVINSDSFKKLQTYIDNKSHIGDKDNLWTEIEMTINRYYPNFKTTIQLLSDYKLSISDYRMILLIKCGITPTQLAILFALTKGSISSRRETLGKRLFNSEIKVKDFDNIVRLI